jgi:hypothetical protein
MGSVDSSRVVVICDGGGHLRTSPFLELIFGFATVVGRNL